MWQHGLRRTLVRYTLIERFLKKFLPYFIFLTFLIPSSAKAQFERFRDSVVQLYGVVMTADSLVGVPAASIMIKGQNRGTISNDEGVFSIVVMKGDWVEFTSIGFKPVSIQVPKDLQGNQHSIIQLMVNDTIYLPATVIRPRPTPQQFARDFINNDIPDDDIATARRATSEEKRRLLMSSLPADGREASKAYFQNQSKKISYAGHAAPQNIFNPFAWSEFVKAWKRGDFKKKK